MYAIRSYYVEVPLGIAFEKVEEIEEGLSKLPETTQWKAVRGAR